MEAVSAEGGERIIEMSIKSSLLRGMYGVEVKPKTAKSKYAFYHQEEAKRGDVRRRAAIRFDAALEKKEARGSLK